MTARAKRPRPKAVEVETGFRGAYRLDSALPCPFCGEPPILVPWHGGGPRKRNLMCWNDACGVEPSVCGSTEAVAIAMWNKRTAAPAAARGK
ncbi:MAG: Lar family restriction alleviation protein [Alphaproteobacteria bacterium]|nr:Lar family restriction alleviation protein [Alphaproteobacteria bacterium]MCW5739631.1 Lar family restriction alleviation protein [Alphaproteobacteria bacterium]